MKDLFGIDIPEVENKHPIGNLTAIQLHAKLLALHGSYPAKCKDCIHFHRREFAKTYFKCLQSTKKESGNHKTDWRANWQACGKFELNHKPI